MPGSEPTRARTRGGRAHVWTLWTGLWTVEAIRTGSHDHKERVPGMVFLCTTIHTSTYTRTMSLLRTSASRAISRSTMFNSVRTYAAGPGGSDAGHTASSTGFREREQVSGSIDYWWHHQRGMFADLACYSAHFPCPGSRKRVCLEAGAGEAQEA